MKLSVYLLLCGLMLVACDKDSEEITDDTGSKSSNYRRNDSDDDDDWDCLDVEFTGAFEAHYDERSGGTCGPIPDAVFIPTASYMEGCSLPQVIESADKCSANTSQTCEFYSYADDIDVVIQLAVTMEIQDPQGDNVTGIFAMTVFDHGALACQSTYDVTMERQ